MAKLLAGTARVTGWLVALLLLAVVVVAALRHLAIDDDERALVARMDAPEPRRPGRNGFAALMLADRDVAPAARDAALAADVDAFARWDAAQAGAERFWSRADADGDFAAWRPFAGVPERGEPPAGDELCALSGAGCLQQVAADPQRTHAALAKHAGRIAAVEDALAADHLRSPYPAAMAAPLPPWQHLRLPLAAAAMDAVSGDVDAAYARTCRLLAGARRADRQAQFLVDKMIAQAAARGAATLLLDLRRGHPVDAFPGECAAARAPVDADEASVCAAMRGEYRLARAHGERMRRQLAGRQPDRLLTRALLFDADLQAVAAARMFAPYCADDARTLAAEGRAPPAVDTTIPALECGAAYVSCVLGRIATPAFTPYAERALDHAAILRLLLAAQRVADGSAPPARAAADASVPGHPVEFDPASQRASIVLHAPSDPAAATYSVELAGLATMPRIDPGAAIAARLAPGTPGSPILRR